MCYVVILIHVYRGYKCYIFTIIIINSSHPLGHHLIIELKLNLFTGFISSILSTAPLDLEDIVKVGPKSLGREITSSPILRKCAIGK